jgi:hypothetical protein
MLGSTASRKNFKSVESFIDEPDSRAQCAALEENVKEFGLTYFGMTDKRQGQSRSLFARLSVHLVSQELCTSSGLNRVSQYVCAFSEELMLTPA